MLAAPIKCTIRGETLVVVEKTTTNDMEHRRPSNQDKQMPIPACQSCCMSVSLSRVCPSLGGVLWVWLWTMRFWELCYCKMMVVVTHTQKKIRTNISKLVQIINYQ